ncbi:hypothetical protein V5799_029515 [Amblyomma americanum]|uniref:ADP-ribosylation factor-related protein 1 n=1 Tax=Amblyomma americanum TaxID=6943 RepID=A0AAQ4ER33_AMBAM
MYTLLSGFWKYISQRDEYYVLILGLDNAGKTTYLEQTKTKFTKGYKALNPHKITTTVGLNIGKIDIHGIRLNFWDLGGQDSLQSLWDKGCYSAAEIRQLFRESSHLIGRRDCHLIGASALHGEGINEGIEWITQCVKRNVLRPSRNSESL